MNKQQSKVSPYLAGNFSPIDKEIDIDLTEVIGEIPKDLSGAFLRNGPNPMFIPDPENHHWFDGDGMIHEVLLKDGITRIINT